jgi:hypothetical protein
MDFDIIPFDVHIGSLVLPLLLFAFRYLFYTVFGNTRSRYDILNNQLFNQHILCNIHPRAIWTRPRYLPGLS